MILFNRETFIPEYNVVVLTLARNFRIGWDYTAYTKVYACNELGKITRWLEMHFEPHGMFPSEEELNEAHERIVRGIRGGSLELAR